MHASVKSSDDVEVGGLAAWFGGCSSITGSAISDDHLPLQNWLCDTALSKKADKIFSYTDVPGCVTHLCVNFPKRHK